MHGGSFTSELAPRFYRALREEPFAYHGMLLGPAAPERGGCPRARFMIRAIKAS